jgi:PST family polysaccharide transporter
MNRKIWENLTALLSVHVLNYVAPLLTLPLLTRVLGPSSWGMLAFAEAYAMYASLIIEYGFSLSATREIAQASEDLSLRSRLLSGVFTAQILLSLAVGASTIALALTVPAFRLYANLLGPAFLLAVFRAVFPAWYFQGLERMKLIAAVNIAANLSSAILIFLIVRAPNQILVPLIVRGIAAFLASAVATYLAMRELPPVALSLKHALRALKQGWSLFLFRSAVSLYTTGNVLLLGVLAPAQVVAWFAGAERITKACTSVFGPITQTFYPRINSLLKSDPDAAKRMAKVSAQCTIGIGVAIGLGLFTLSPFIVRVALGHGFLPAVIVLRWLSVLPPLIAASTVLGIQWMLPLRLDSAYTKIIVAGGLLNILLAIWLVPRYQEKGMAMSVAAAELLVTIAVYTVLRLRKADPWSQRKSGRRRATSAPVDPLIVQERVA